MAFLSVVNTEHATLVTDRLVVPAEQIEPFATAADAAQRLSALHAAMDARVRDAEETAREAGRREGLAAGEAHAAEQLGTRLLALEQRAERERAALRARAVDNALAIVRRIASTLGDAETLAALARDAARELMPCAVVVVQVHPAQLDAVRDRLTDVSRDGRGRDAGALAAAADEADEADEAVEPASGEAAPLDVALVVEAEESLERGQCRLRTEGGVAVLAGLETQLRSIERLTRDGGARRPASATG